MRGLLLEVALRERASRARLEIPLEADRPLLIRELNDDMKLPGAMSFGMRAAACVVVVQPAARIGRQTRIEVRSRISVLENVDEALVFSHVDGLSKRDALGERGNVAETPTASAWGRSSCQT